MPLEPCPSCRRHHRVDDAACPFCRAPSPVRAALLSGVTAAALALSGCPDPGSPKAVAPVYGAPPEVAHVQSDTPAPAPPTPAPPTPAPAPTPAPPPAPPMTPVAPAYGAPPNRPR